MNVVLFDKCSNRRAEWKRLTSQRSLAMQAFDVVTEEALASSASPRIIIFDQSVVADCLTATQELIPKLTQDIVTFSVADYQASTIVRLLQRGAVWVFDNALATGTIDADFEELLVIAAEFQRRRQTHHTLQSLLAKVSPAEKEVLALVLEGMPNKMIANQLNISVRTVESRRSKIYRKCEVKSITGLVRFADQAESLKQQFEPGVTQEPAVTHVTQATQVLQPSEADLHTPVADLHDHQDSDARAYQATDPAA